MAKYQIRKGCFETNSSSMHSLIITNSDDVYTKEEIRHQLYLSGERDILDLWYIMDSDDYGREFNFLRTFSEKLGYAIAEFCGNNYSIKNYLDAEDCFSSVFMPILEEVADVKEVKYRYEHQDFIIYEDTYKEDADGNFDPHDLEEVPYEDIEYTDDYRERLDYSKSGRRITEIDLKVVDFSSIDHQSSGLLKGFLKKYGITLKDFLIRKDIVVVIDGDEYCIFDNMANGGVIDMGNIKAMFPNRLNLDEKE